MSSTDSFENDENKSLKGKEFDEVCQLVDDRNAKVFVHQKPSGSGRWDFCFSFMLGEYDELDVLEKIAEGFGAGEFPVQIKSKQDDGRPKILWQKNMHVVARRSSVTRPAVAPQVAGAGLDVLAAALENQTCLLTAVLEKVSQQSPAPVQQSRKEFAKEMLAMKELFADNRPSGIESVREMFELQKIMIEASGGDVDPLTQAIKTLGPEIVEGVKAMREKAQRDRTAPQRPVLPARLAAVDVQPTFANIDVESAYSIFAENYLGKLLESAGHPAEDVANYVVRLVGGNARLLHVVGRVIQEDDMIDRLAKFDARVMQHAHWLDDVADWLAHALWPDANDAPTPENAIISATVDEISDSHGTNSANAASTDQDAIDDDGLEDPDDATGTSAPRGKLDNDP